MATITTRKALELEGDQEFASVEVTVILSSAELLALSSSPVVIVPGVVGKAYTIQRVLAIYRAGATPYTFPDGIHAVYTIDGVQGVNFGPDFITQVDDQFVDAGGPNPWQDALADIDGVGISITCGAGDPTLGDGTLEVTVRFREIPT